MVLPKSTSLLDILVISLHLILPAAEEAEVVEVFDSCQRELAEAVAELVVSAEVAEVQYALFSVAYVV